MFKIFRRKKEYVLISRDQQMKKFWIQRKRNFINELNYKESWFGWLTIIVNRREHDIIEMIHNGHKFYTYNYIDKTFTEVEVAFNNLRSKANDTKVDNISNLPIDYKL